MKEFKDMIIPELVEYLENHQCEEYGCTICLSAFNELKRKQAFIKQYKFRTGSEQSSGTK